MFKALILMEIMNMGKVKLCLTGVLTEVYLLTPLSLTSALRLGHSGVGTFKDKK